MTTIESMLRFGLLNLRQEHLTPDEKISIDTAPLEDLVALTQAANARMMLAHMSPTRFSN